MAHKVALGAADERLRRTVQEALPADDVRNMPVFTGLESAAALLRWVNQTRPLVLLIEFGGATGVGVQAIREIQASAAAPKILALGASKEAQDILAAYRAGVADYVVAPYDDLLRVYHHVAEEARAAREAQPANGNVIGVMGVKGGTGATTVACHLAANLAQFSAGPVLLIDADASTGMAGFLTKANSPHTLADVCRNLHRLDANFFGTQIARVSGGYDVVKAPAAHDAAPPEQVGAVLEFARTRYDWVVLDWGSSAAEMALADHFNEMLLCATADIPSFYAAKSRVALLRQRMRAPETRLVLNRAPRVMDMTPQELERVLDHPLFALLPNDYVSLSESYAHGKLLSESSKLGRALAQLARKLSGVEEEAPADSGLLKVFGWAKKAPVRSTAA